MSTDQITLKPSLAAESLRDAIATDQALCFWGSPGIGKSQIVHQVAAELGKQVCDIRAVLLDAVDLRGLPHVEDGMAKWAIPSFLPATGDGVLFLDELNRAPAMVQNGLLQLSWDRKLGDYSLPAGWSIVAACNDTDTGVNRVSSALASRFTHINVEPDLDDWCKWAITAGQIEPIVIAFLRFRPNLLSAYDRNAHAFPSPRAWQAVSRFMANPNANTDVLMALIAGAVGHAAAIEFMAFWRLYQSMPNLDAILLDPAGAIVPSDMATCYAVAAGLSRKASQSNWSRVLTYLERLQPEYTVFAVRDATTRDPLLAATPEFTRWSIDHQDYV